MAAAADVLSAEEVVELVLVELVLVEVEEVKDCEVGSVTVAVTVPC